MTISRRKVLHLGIGLAAGSAFASLPGLANAAPLTWDMSDEYGGNAQTGIVAKFFVEELNKRIGDELEITYHGSKALGFNSVDHFDAVQFGAVPIAVTQTSQLGGLEPFFDLTSLPFLVKDLAEARTLWGVSKPEFARIFDANNMVVLYAQPNAPSGIWAKKPIDSVEALKGLRIRTYDANGTRTFAAAGAAPLQIAFSDLIPQLSTGGVDAVLTSAEGGIQLSAWDYLTDFTALNYAMALFMVHANKDSYNELSDTAKAAIEEVSALTEDFAWTLVTNSIEESYETARSHNMTVTDTPPREAFEHLQAAGAELKTAWLEKVGERGEQVLAAFEAAKS